MRIRSRLLLLVLSVLLPAFLGAALAIGYMYQEEQEFNRQSMRETARALALVLDKEFAKREAVLRTLAASPALDRGDFDTFYKQAKALADTNENVILLSDLNGQQFLNTRKPWGATGLPGTKPIRALRERHGPGATVVSNLYMAQIGRDYSFAIQMPVMRDGKVLYYIAMGSFARQLQSVFEQQQLPPEWHAGIVDRNGVFVARSKEPEKYIGHPVSSDFARKMNDSPDGFYEGVTRAGWPAVAFFSRAPQSEWVFFVVVPKAVVQRSAVNAVMLMGGISLLLLGLAVIASFAFSRRTAQPIEALRHFAERLGRGEAVAPRHCGVVEIDEVGDAMAQADRDIRGARAELEQRVAAAVDAAERSQRALLQAQKLEALGRLTGGIAHDFNNVLQTVSTGLELALMRATDARMRDALESCQRALRRAGELTGQLAVFGRVQKARMETVDPACKLQEIRPLLKGGLRDDIALHIDAPAPLWPVTLDTLQFELALLNLAINARDATPGSGSLRIEARNESLHDAHDEMPAGDYVRIAVSDEGEGMSPEVLAKAVDPFFTTKSVGKGSGMGLAQVYGFARQSGGTLQLHSKPGAGTQVVLYLPRATCEAEPEAREESVAPRRAGGETVLLVEDDALVRDMVRTALLEAGFAVCCAGDGEQALQLLESEERVKLVFSDIVMPGAVSGIDLAEAVLARFPQMRVVLATGYTERQVALPGVRTLAKPYNVAQAVEALQDALEAQYS